MTDKPPTHKSTSNGALPTWVTIIVVLGLLLLLGWNIIVVGPEGIPNSYIIGGLLGAYTGVNEWLKHRRGSSDDQQQKGP